MILGLDVRPSLVRPTGVGSYVLALAERLPAAAPQHRFFFFSSSLRDRYPSRSWPANVTLVDRRLPVRALNLAWNRLGWPPLERLVGSPLDLVHSPHPLMVPSRTGRHVVTLHDLFFLKRPEATRAEIRRDYTRLVREHVRRADGVICVSHFTAAEARASLDVEPGKLVVVPNGVHEAFRTPASEAEIEAALTRTALPRGGLIYVGSAEERKNLPRLIRAYRELSSRRSATPPLILVGPGPGWPERLPPRPGGVHTAGHLAVGDLRGLMAASKALVLASLEEGFGLPVVEAMAAGLPVVCSRGSALEEVAGGAACLVEPLEVASIAAGLERVLDDEDLAASLRRRGHERSRAFDWDRSARQTLDFYERVLAA
jgi:glycosyltransferase involved in cell wall biosynthesis